MILLLTFWIHLWIWSTSIMLISTVLKLLITRKRQIINFHFAPSTSTASAQLHPPILWLYGTHHWGKKHKNGVGKNECYQFTKSILPTDCICCCYLKSCLVRSTRIRHRLFKLQAIHSIRIILLLQMGQGFPYIMVSSLTILKAKHWVARALILRRISLSLWNSTVIASNQKISLTFAYETANIHIVAFRPPALRRLRTIGS